MHKIQAAQASSYLQLESREQVFLLFPLDQCFYCTHCDHVHIILTSKEVYARLTSTSFMLKIPC